MLRDRHSIHRRRCVHVLLSLLFVIPAVAMIACGIAFTEGDDETELWKSLTVDGTFVAGEPLTLVLTYEQPYTVAIDVQCDLLDDDPDPTATPEFTPTPFGGREGETPPPTIAPIPRVRPTPVSKVLDVLVREIPANPEGGIAGEVTPVPGVIEQRFFGPEEAGRYELECFTPLDINNTISRTFSIIEAAE